MIAANLPTLLLVVGILILCITTAVTALSLPGFEWTSRRRHDGEADDRSDETEVHSLYPPVLSRRVITGHPAALPPATPPASDTPAPDSPAPRMIGAIELPAKAPRHIGAPTDRPITTAAAAEALIEQLIDDDPERMADLMMQWMKSDARRSERSQRA